MVKARLGGSAGGDGYGGDGGSRGGGASASGDVVELDDGNFDETLLDSEGMWLVAFVAPWCGHCKNLKPEWAKAATELKGIINVAVVDATANEGLSGRFGVQGFPTIKMFP